MGAGPGVTVRGRVRTEPCHKRIRGYLGGRLVCDTTSARYVWEQPTYPAYYVPVGDVRAQLLETGDVIHSPSRGDGVVYDVRIGEAVSGGTAVRFTESPIEELRDLIRFAWTDDFEWLEEDEPVYTHPRDPYTRVDILGSSRRVRVELDGVELADSSTPRILFETGLPPRFYLPMSDVRMDLLVPTDSVTHCPYKGAASYWSVDLGDNRYDDVAWCYRTPLPESQKIAGLVCFYNERVDLFVDGVRQDRPHTKFS